MTWLRCVVLGSLVVLHVFAIPALGQGAALFDELAILCPDTAVATGSDRFRSDSPLDVPVGVHVLVTGLEPGAEVQLGLPTLARSAVQPRLFELLAVPVEQNTGLGSRTEQWDGKENPYVVREAPFEVYEVLKPAGAVFTADESGSVALRLELFANRELAAAFEDEFVEVQLESGDWQATLTWLVYLHDVHVPATGPQSPGYTNWFSPGAVASRHGLELWSEPFWEMLGKYADLMQRGRQNTFWIRWGDFMALAEDGSPQLDQARLQRYVELFLARGFTHLEGGHLAHRHEGDWGSARLDLILTGHDVTSDEGAESLAALMREIEAGLESLELPGEVIYLQHLTDEPTSTNAGSYQALAKQVREHMPGVKIFDATMCTELVEAVDHWCPQVQVYQANRDFFEARKEAGDEVWVYTCLIPGGKYLNRLLDQERLRPVYLGWSLVRYDLYGFLHWGFNHYRSGQDPLKTSVVPHGKGPPNYLPAGDTHVVYPGEDGPWSGQRFEAHRIGMEDAEMLRVLKRREPELAAEIIGQVFRAYDDYETEVAKYREARRRLIEALADRDG